MNILFPQFNIKAFKNNLKRKTKNALKVLQINKFKEFAYLKDVCSCQINQITVRNGDISDKGGKGIGFILVEKFMSASQCHQLCCSLHLLCLTDILETLEVPRHNVYKHLIQT